MDHSNHSRSRSGDRQSNPHFIFGISQTLSSRGLGEPARRGRERAMERRGRAQAPSGRWAPPWSAVAGGWAGDTAGCYSAGGSADLLPAAGQHYRLFIRKDTDQLQPAGYFCTRASFQMMSATALSSWGRRSCRGRWWWTTSLGRAS